MQKPVFEIFEVCFPIAQDAESGAEESDGASEQGSDREIEALEALGDCESEVAATSTVSCRHRHMPSGSVNIDSRV